MFITGIGILNQSDTVRNPGVGHGLLLAREVLMATLTAVADIVLVPNKG